MAALDPLAVRMYRNQTEGSTKDAERLRGYVAAKVTDLQDRDLASTTVVGDVQRLAADVAELLAHVTKLATLTEVSYLIINADSE